jgi:hypothetical protein
MPNSGQTYCFLTALFYGAWKTKILDIFGRSVSDSLLTFFPNFHIPNHNTTFLSCRRIQNFLLRCIHYTGGFIVTILIRLILYISYFSPILSPPLPALCSTSSSCKRFLNYVSYKYIKSIYHIQSPQSPLFTLRPSH